MLFYPYTQKSIDRILGDIKQGQITVSEFPSNVIQVHLPYIEKKNVINIYPVFDLDQQINSGLFMVSIFPTEKIIQVIFKKYGT